MDEDAFHARFLKIRLALAPPKPKEFVNTYFSAASCGWRTSGNRQRGSAVCTVQAGGSHCPCKAIRQMAASTAPAAPRRCPMEALVELTGICAADSPAQRLMAAASAE